MSSAASSPVGRAGHRIPRNRPSTVRRRTFSTSVMTTTSNGSLPRVTLAEWQVPSLSDLHSSNAGSQIDLEAAIRRHFSSPRRSSGSTSADIPGLHRTSTTPSRRAAVRVSRNSPVYPRLMPVLPPPTPGREEAHDISRRPLMRGFPLDCTSRPDPEETSMRRAPETSAEVDHTLIPPARPGLDVPRPFSFTYDPERRRLTGLEDWQIHFPNESSDPFAGLEVSEAEMEHITSLSSAYDIYKLLYRRITQKLESLASTAKARIPKAFKVMINTIEKRTPNHETHDISAPFNVVHSMTVRSDPTTGRLLGMPEQWTTPPTNAQTHAAKKGVSQGSFWGALRREIKAPREALRAIQLSRSSSTSHTPMRRNSRSRRASFSEHQTKTPAAGDYERGQIHLGDTEIRFHPHNGSAPIRIPSTSARRPRRKAVPELTADEWKEINAPRIPRAHLMPQPLPTPTTFVRAPRQHRFPYAPAHGPNGFPGQWVPMYPPAPVFFGSYDDLTLPR